MILDFHIHSNTSGDCRMKIREAYDAAVSKGLKFMCITNHHEPGELAEGRTRYVLLDESIAKCKAEITELRKEGKIQIFFGAEVGYSVEQEDNIKEFLSKNEFDFVLGSVHFIKGISLGTVADKDKVDDPDEILKIYRHRLKKAIKSRLFDVMAHLDIYNRVLDGAGFSDDEWGEIAELLLEQDVGFELNTSRARPYANDGKYTQGLTYPSREIVELLVKKGVKKITIGSDSHQPDDIGYGIDEAEEFLRSLGIEEVYRFEKRKAIAERL